jgi:UDPglucose 6-dehydrogenase
MKIGMVGLGKLGLPIALAIEDKGHEVRGFDKNPVIPELLAERVFPHNEAGAQQRMSGTEIMHTSVLDLVRWSDLIFVAVQTPHQSKFEGTAPLPADRADFDYSHLRAAAEELVRCAKRVGHCPPAVIISTVLPGTIERELLPIVEGHVRICYNPFFIAMGTAIQDFLNPEFVLFGAHDAAATSKAREFYATIHDAPVFVTTVRNAELIKVLYNTYISTKLGFINSVAQLCDVTGADADVVSDALCLATDRIISPKYLRAGMGDGGGCHPRDNIALSWLAREKGLKYDWFGDIMLAREKHTEWLADMVEAATIARPGQQVYICGTAFKADTDLEVGSPALLLHALLAQRDITAILVDPHVTVRQSTWGDTPAIFFVGANHTVFQEVEFPPGSLVIDPWGMIGAQDGVERRRPGRLPR